MEEMNVEKLDAMPMLGLGTWKSAPGEVYQAVKTAIELGYRHIDCAAIYGNEKEVGQAISESIAAGTVTREELWITSKPWNDHHGRENIIPAIKQTLEDLQLDYLDLYLIHWAVPQKVANAEKAEDFYTLEERPLTDTWKGMEDAVHAGLTRHIGMCNFSVKKLQQIIDSAEIMPMVNQVEMHPYLRQQALVDFCQDNGIVVTAYSPLGSNDNPLRKADAAILLKDETVAAIAEKRGCTPAQVLLAWNMQRGVVVIPKSVNPVRLQQNLDALNVSLTEEDMDTINGLDKHYRYLDGSFWCVPGNPHTVENLWDE